MAKKQISKPVQSLNSKSVMVHPVYCHLCKVNFKDKEVFRLHIMKKHRPRSNLYEGESDTSSDPEEELQIKTEVEVKSGEDDEIYDTEMIDYTKSLFNISETAVSPQSSSSITNSKGKNSLQIFSLSKCDQLEGNKATEQVIQSSTPLNPSVVYNSSVLQNPVINPQSQITFSNDQSQLVNFCTQQQLLSGYLGGNQTFAQNQTVTNQVEPTANLAFALNVRNIVQWHNKWKKISKPLKDPLPKGYLKKIKIVHKTIFDALVDGLVLGGEEKQAVFKIFQEMENILCHSAEYAGKNL